MRNLRLLWIAFNTLAFVSMGLVATAEAPDASYTVRVRTSGVVGLKETGSSMLLLVGDFRDLTAWPVSDVAEHYAYLAVRDEAWVRGGPPSELGPLCQFAGYWRKFPLTGYDVRLVGAPGGVPERIRGARRAPQPCRAGPECSATGPFSRQAADLGWVVPLSDLTAELPGSPRDKSLNRDYLASPCLACQGMIAARVELRGGFIGSVLWKDYDPRSYDIAQFTGSRRLPQALAREVEHIFTTEGELALELTPFDGGVRPDPIVLDSPGGIMDVILVNEPRTCHDPSDHFKLHYNLLTNPSVLGSYPSPSPGTTGVQCSPIEYRP